MNFLRFLRKKSIMVGQDLPSNIEPRVNLIEELYEQAALYHDEELERPVADFDEHITKLRKEKFSEKQEDWLLKELNRCRESSQKREQIFPYVDEVTLMADLTYDPDSEFASIYEPYPGLLEAGDKLEYLCHMLMALWLYWILPPDARYIATSQPKSKRKKLKIWTADSEEALDLSLAKIAFRVGVETFNIHYWKKKKEAVVKINLSQKIHNNNKVLEAFHQVRKKQGDTLNSIVVRIFKYFNKNEQTKLNKGGSVSPGVKTIERAIKANKSLIETCFKEEQHGTKKRWIYIGQTGD